jgi:hypothetical protein
LPGRQRNDVPGYFRGSFPLPSVRPLAPGGRDPYTLLRHLYNIFETNIELDGKLVLRIYDEKLVGPSYEKDLLNIVTKLYGLEQKELADSICIAVGETGSLILKEVYNKNRLRKRNPNRNRDVLRCHFF